MSNPNLELSQHIRSTYPAIPDYDILKSYLDEGANPHLEIRVPGSSRPLDLFDYIVHKLYSRDEQKYSFMGQNTQDDWKYLKLLLDHGADPNKMISGDLYYPLGYLSSIPKDVELLLRYGADPNSIARFGGRTPLMSLLRQFDYEPSKRRMNDFLESAKLLIQSGAGLNIPDKKGDTPNKSISKLADSGNPDKKEFGSQLQKIIAEYKESVRRKQEEIRENAFSIIEQPGGLKERARRATNSNFRTDVATKAGLCKILDDEMYRTELYNLAREMGLSVTAKTTKKELCEMIAAYGLSVI